MKRRIQIGLGMLITGGVMTVVAAGCSGGVANGSTDLQLAYEAPAGTAQEIAANIFSDTVEEASDGTVTVKQYPGGQLGGESDMLDKVRAGDVDIAITSVANASGIMPESSVLSLHYLAKDSNEAFAIFSSNAVNDEYKRIAEKSLEGIAPLALFMLPIRNIYGSEEVSTPADLDGTKMRVQASPTEDVLFGAYGAQTVHLAAPELYSALQTGLVDTAEGAVTSYEANNHYEVAPVMSMTQHELNGQVLWMSTDVLESLSDDQIAAIEEAAGTVTDEQPQEAVALGDDTHKDLEGKGVKFHDDVDTEAFAKIARPFQDEIAADISDDAVTFLDVIRQSLTE